MRVILFILLVVSSFLTFSQNHFRYDQIQVINSVGDTIKNPFGGGFNAPQFSEIDLNFDGIKDLFVFDRDTGYYLIGANDPGFRKYGTGSFLVLEQIRKCFEHGIKAIDFIGINSPNRGDFKTSFNAQPFSFFTVYTNLN